MKKESEKVEFKKSLSQLDEAIKSVCSFANHKGGMLYFGVDNIGKIIGLQVSENTLRNISQHTKTWDEQVCSDAVASDIDEHAVQQFLAIAGSERRLDINTKTSLKEALLRLGLLQKKKYTNAAVNATIKDTIKDTIISGTAQNILENMGKNPQITAEELSKLIPINLRNIKKNIKMLKDKKMVERQGSRKSGYWEIVKQK